MEKVAALNEGKECSQDDGNDVSGKCALSEKLEIIRAASPHQGGPASPGIISIFVLTRAFVSPSFKSWPSSPTVYVTTPPRSLFLLMPQLLIIVPPTYDFRGLLCAHESISVSTAEPRVLVYSSNPPPRMAGLLLRILHPTSGGNLH